MNRVLITKPMVGICHMQVCAASDATDEEILEVCNRENPSGTTNGWGIVHRADHETWGTIAPVACADNPDRLHIIVGC